MSKPTDFGVGLMHETAITASKVGWEPEDFAKLSKDENLMKMFCGVLRGTHEIKGIEHVIDCNAQPFIPDGSKVEEHQQGGMVKFDATKTDFYLSKKQKGGTIEGNKLHKELEGKKVMNANVLDYLLANPKAIPDDWKQDEKGNTRYIFFWGTIYRYSHGNLCVRCLYWGVGRWYWSFYWLDYGWGSNYPTLLVK